MNNFHIDSIENFLTAFFNRAGGIVEKLEYGLATVLLPDEIARFFPSEELLLAFDYEVAQENPGSIFVTPGSPLLDTTVRLAMDYGRYTKYYWPGKKPQLPKNFPQRIGQVVDYLSCRPPQVTSHWAAENIYYIFYFLCTFRSYEKTEEVLQIVLNASSGLPYPAFSERWEGIVPLKNPEYQLGKANLRPLNALYKLACRECRALAEEKALHYQEEAMQLRQHELHKTENYYGEIISELEEKAAAIPEEERKKRLKKQLEAARIDQKRRQKDITARYEVEAEIRLDHLLACHVPCLYIKLEIQHKNIFLHHTVSFNPVTGEIESPACPRCGKPTRLLLPDLEKMEFICPAHLQK